MGLLDDIYSELNELKEQVIADHSHIENSFIIFDNMANALKNNDLKNFLNKMITKVRHLSFCFGFTLQLYYLFPLLLNKQITNATIFKPKNKKDMETIFANSINLNEELSQFFDYIYDKAHNHFDV